MSIINTNKNKPIKEPINTGFCPPSTGAKSPFPEKHFSGSVSSHDLVFHAFGSHSKENNKIKLSRTITK